MVKIKTYLDRSPINGIGLYADENIQKGTVIWDLDQKFDKLFHLDTVNFAREEFKMFLMKYCYLDNDNFEGPMFVLCIDDARFMNHSDMPNTINGDGNKTIADRDILMGEEITCNYFEIDDFAKEKFNIK